MRTGRFWYLTIGGSEIGPKYPPRGEKSEFGATST